MIAKEVTLRSAKKSDFAGLAKYLTDKQRKEERVGYLSVTNCQSDQAEIAVLEILNTQALNTRAASDKTYHLIVSFRPGEQPDKASLQTIETRICAGLGFADHQRVSVVHRDTDNLHIHIAINKIHPTRYTVHTPYYSKKILSALCVQLEREMGLEVDNHRAHKSKAENQTANMEHQAGVESLLGWIKRECFDQIQAAQSWAELHQVMGSNGLRLHEQGNGLVVTAENGTTVKASSIGREYSKKKLEARFGTFVPAPEPLTDTRPAKKYEPKPMRSRVDTSELYVRYQNDQIKVGALRTAAWEQAKIRKHNLIEAAKRAGRLKRAAIKPIPGARVSKKILYAAINQSLRKNIKEINEQYFKEHQEAYDLYRRRAWVDWLRAKAIEGDQEALAALQAREEAQSLRGDTVGGKGEKHPIWFQPRPDSITKKGTIIYCVGVTTIRDDGDNLKISPGADQSGLQVALRMAHERYGESISVNGSDTFKEQITEAAVVANLPIVFDDQELENRRRSLQRARAPSISSERRDISGVGLAARQAANIYIAEREEKRRQGIDIPKHVLFNGSLGGAATYAGTRQVEGQMLALLKRAGEILVVPIDAQTALRLRRLTLGDSLTVSDQGYIKRQGRSR